MLGAEFLKLHCSGEAELRGSLLAGRRACELERSLVAGWSQFLSGKAVALAQRCAQPSPASHCSKLNSTRLAVLLASGYVVRGKGS